MDIDLHGHPDVTVPGDLTDHVRRHAEIEQHGHAGVAEIMEAQRESEGRRSGSQLRRMLSGSMGVPAPAPGGTECLAETSCATTSSAHASAAAPRFLRRSSHFHMSSASVTASDDDSENRLIGYEPTS